MRLVLVKKVLHHSVVERLGTLGLRSKKINEEEKLDPVEIGDEVEGKAEEVINEAEETKDDPVGKPFFVIVS